MSEIPNITTREIQIRGIEIPTIFDYTQSYSPLPVAPPVVVNIGTPIVNIPGCVEAREINSKNLPTDDLRGNLVLCDGTVPSFDPLMYEPNQMLPTPKSGIDTRLGQPKTPETPELPIPITPPATAVIECPTQAQLTREPVGTYLEGFRKQVTGYQLIGNECVQLTEKVPLPEQVVAGLPTGGQVVQVGGVAVIATASALLAKPLADVLLKAVKPAVKKVMKKIAAVRGKTLPVLSVGERRAEQRQMNQAVKALRSVFPRKKKR